MKSPLVRILALILLVFTLAGCSGGQSAASDAEKAAVRFGIASFNDGAIVVPWSTAVWQVQEVKEDIKLVLFTFNRLTVDGPERCLMLYETRPDPKGLWSINSGGGSCNGQIKGMNQGLPALDSSWGTISNPNAAAVTNSLAYYGVVHDENIVKVRFSWDDGFVFDADVINSSYLVTRDGQLDARIEGLDADGAVVYVDVADIPVDVAP